jgi:hypothetical protein
MTPEQIDKMPAGREMDVAVAEATGWRWTHHPMADGKRRPLLWKGEPPPRGDDFNLLEDGRYVPWDLPPFSTDIAAAWPVFEEMPEPRDEITVAPGTPFARSIRQGETGEWVAGWQFKDGDGRTRWHGRTSASGETAPLAISRARLRAAHAARAERP